MRKIDPKPTQSEHAQSGPHSVGVSSFRKEIAYVCLEAHCLPFAVAGTSTRQACEDLCTQTDMDFVVVDRADRILLNSRLAIPERIKKAQKELAGLLDSNEESSFTPEELRAAIQRHQARFEAAKVPY